MVNAVFYWLQTETFEREKGYIMTTMAMKMNIQQRTLFDLIGYQLICPALISKFF